MKVSLLKKVTLSMNYFNHSYNLLIFILLVNTIVTFVYLLWKMMKKEYRKGLMMSCFMFLVPIAGPLYLALSSLIYEGYFKNKKEVVNIEELSFSKKKIEHLEKENIESALNKVPIQEALQVSDAKNTRRLLLNVLKEDTEDYIQVINQATANKDSEVSHYAATALSDIINKFKQKNNNSSFLF